MRDVAQRDREVVPHWNGRPYGDMPEGDVDLWMVATDDEGRVVAAGRLSNGLQPIWHNGDLCLDYGPVTMIVFQSGPYSRGVIVAVSRITQRYQEVFHIGLGRGHINVGENMTVVDGIIKIGPEAK